jgi:hypothetical protein
MKKMDTQIQTPTKQRKTIPRNPMKPTEQSERRNATSNQGEFHRGDTRHGQPKCRADTQEIPRQQK